MITDNDLGIYTPYVGEIVRDGTITLIANDVTFRPGMWRRLAQRKKDVSWSVWYYGNNWTCIHPTLVGMEKTNS